jgi:uncharacterized UBP type Zn finger protein
MREGEAMDDCTHLDGADPAPTPTTPTGCEECLATGGHWVSLRLCLACGHVGCCNDSPARHAMAHHRQSEHPLVRSYEPGQDWWWCYVDEVGFEVEGAPSAPSY